MTPAKEGGPLPAAAPKGPSPIFAPARAGGRPDRPPCAETPAPSPPAFGKGEQPVPARQTAL